MTLVVSWIGVDTHGISSAYIASESRISRKNSGNFDYGRKVFSFENYPDILGYCGDVAFSSMILSQTCEMVNNGLLFGKDFSSLEKSSILFKTVKEAHSTYPDLNNFEIIHISRDPKDNFSFKAFYFGLHDEFWFHREIDLPKNSDVVKVIGSGSSFFDEKYAIYQNGKNKNTTRNVFHSFCSTLSDGKDPACGGPPQLVGLIRKPDSSAINFGIIYNQTRYFFGAKIDNPVNTDIIEWRNEQFELCDGRIMVRFKNAKRQPDYLNEE